MKFVKYGNEAAKTVLVYPVSSCESESSEPVYNAVKEMSGADIMMLTVQVDDWNRDLSPWKAQPVFGNEAFDGAAEDTLRAILEACADKDKRYYIGGYSLAGLFSLWAGYRTDLFSGIAAASPSVWFPDFYEYIKARTIKCGLVYLSLGDREEKTRNPVMVTVGDWIRGIYEKLGEEKVNCVLEWNSGGHFNDPDERTAKAFAWVVNNGEKRLDL